MKTKKSPGHIDAKTFCLKDRRTLMRHTDLSEYLRLAGLNMLHVYDEAIEDSSCFRVSYRIDPEEFDDGNIRFTRQQADELAHILEANFLNIEGVRLTRDSAIEITYTPDDAEWKAVIVPMIRGGHGRDWLREGDWLDDVSWTKMGRRQMQASLASLDDEQASALYDRLDGMGFFSYGRSFNSNDWNSPGAWDIDEVCDVPGAEDAFINFMADPTKNCK